MKIAHLTTSDISLRHLLWTQIEAARAAGHEVIGISAAGPDVAWLQQRGVRHVTLRSSTRSADLRSDLRAMRELWHVLRVERPAVLHTHNPKTGLYGRVVGRLAGVPRIVNTCHGLWATPDDPLPRRAAVYALEAIAARCSDVELIQNPEDLALLRRLRIVPRRKLRLLGNGIDLARFRPGRLAPDERLRRRAELGIAAEDVVVGAVGRLVAEKGYPELMEAVERLGAGYRLLVVGGADPAKADDLPAALVDGARAAGAVFLGQRDDVEDLYGLMDVFVLASHREGFPRAAMEAAASGLAVVATDIRGCRQVVEDGVTGALVPVGDVAALAAAIVEWQGGAGGLPRARAESHFDARDVDRMVVESYEVVTPLARPKAARSRTKRAVDVVGAAVALVVLSPLFGAVAAAVRVLHGRPVLFRQQRPGLDGQPFEITKFRTMRDAFDADGVALPDAERLTRFGRFLRSTSLDELPELLNVLRGDMSLVGPRPLLMEYLDQYTAEERQRHLVRPGITGLAQVNGRNLTAWDDRLALDVAYVRDWSLALDLRILWRTVRTVVSRSGIAAEGHDTMPHLDRSGSS